MESYKKKPLDLVIDKNNFNLIIQKITKNRKKEEDGRSYIYDTMSYPWNGKNIKLFPKHVPLEDVLKNAKSNCNICNGKGYQFVYIPKSKYPDPGDFLVDIDYLPKNDSVKEQERWKKEQENISVWKIMEICLCAVKKTHKKNPMILSNALHNIWMILDYEIVENVNKD